ncbi:hypothetical protein DyAD56_03550 [Dyella sp. AD56]|uniref:hypothetical protein n=1 Tax=Dyella sp. AD56 TaxID=1528744 RepID=UPI000C84ABE5|nr:hypothetical protein [Dyella sp. AD56]PMQ06545.1 hypothetical protein DyAD56_03550 [Dyella sp. AD56]
MPKPLPRSFSDNFLRSNGIYDLDPETQLQPIEAAVLMGRSLDALERARKAGDPPPFHQAKPRAAVRYVLRDVLAARRLHRHASSAEVGVAHDAAVRGYPQTFSAFMAMAHHNDEWLFTQVGKERRPVDFFTALQDVPLSQRHGVAWMTLDAYTDLLGKVADRPEVQDGERKS